MQEEDVRSLAKKFYVIDEHPNYAINPFGVVYNIKRKNRLNPIEDDRGYLRVKLDGKKELVSRLVAKQFVDNPYNKPNVRYRDGNKRNLYFKNLEWATNSEIKRPDHMKRII